MLTHWQIWTGIEALASKNGLTPSGMAKKAGLDPTTFNKSKRTTASGKPRWPSTESIAKILEATNASFDDFSRLVITAGGETPGHTTPIPLIGFAQAGVGGFFDDGGFPVGGSWDLVKFPEIRDENAYALEVSGNSMEPMYREGDILIVSPGSEIRRHDRVIVKTLEGQVLAKELLRKTATQIELYSLNPEHQTLSFTLQELDWIARIIWASQ
ncbi:MAG: helix-turn-helix transcriptional regulator [bacterium]|nr:helix-turn-helix transcriptional regulator [bacterium]